jgi:CheY-like chemotaxis protein
LLVEDHADGREMLRCLLELWGHQVESAADGLQGVHKALSWRPDVAIVDIGLPQLTGYEVAQQLRAKFGHEIFLIALTGYCQPRDKEQAFAAGFNVHLSKPADLEELARLITTA